ncbi:MAG TPA: hypothetical protein EYQ15_04565 [Candidatus Poseidoniales archaeon]|nr:MAG: hypothetical protein CXT65_05775 [Euryarchaeota archaeon]HIG38558.1 hypothetical protein [Candidatus Poseidoniales archaeon]HIL44488.1 hypothetical protein [Candidatus Poseidoniales archaeon]
MRRIAMLQCFLMLTTVLMMCTVPSASADAAETVIDDDLTWTGEQSVEGTVRIVSGGHLTIDGTEARMYTGSSIVVESGGELTLTQASIVAKNLPTAIASMGYWDEVNMSKFKVPGEGISGAFSVKMQAMEGDSYYGGAAHVAGESININGSSHTFSFADGTGDVWIGLTGYSSGAVTVASITIEFETGGSSTILGSDLESVNMRGAGEQGFTIEVEGEMTSSNSVISGGQIVINGAMSVDDSDFDRVGPVILGNTGEIELLGESGFSDSLDDHDVQGGPNSVIYWGEDVSGSGGLIDRWERRVSDQTIQVDADYVVLRITGIGPQEATQETFSLGGFAAVDSGRERVVEIGYSDGTIWTESATIEVVTYETGWNPESSGIGNYGGGPVALGWTQNTVLDSGTPFIEWESVEIASGSSTKSIGQSMPILAQLANRGTASALLYFTCDVVETGLEADIGGYREVLIDAGESVEISFGWRSSEVGDATLSCRILTPSQLVEDSAFGGGSMSTGLATWTEPADDDSLPILPLLTAIIVGIGIAGMTVLRRGASDAIVETEEESLSYSQDEN